MMVLPSTVSSELEFSEVDHKVDGTGGESALEEGFAVEPTPFLYNIRGARFIILVLRVQMAANSFISKQGRWETATRKCWLSKTYH